MLDFQEKNAFLSEEQAKNEIKKCLTCSNPLCKKNGCPANMDIPRFIKYLKNDDIDMAYQVLCEYSNMSSICSRVCDYYRQCIGACILNAKNNPVKIGLLEKYVFDKKGLIPFRKEMTNHKVAIIGSGPAGLSCALELVKYGINADVYEKENQLGGLLAYGIPSYRLPRNILDEYINYAKSCGVNFYPNVSKNPKELFEKYEYVFMATGLPKYKKMGIPGEDLEGVYLAGPYLKEVNSYYKFNEGNPITLSGTTIVVGAGNVAMDCARTSIRIGSDKTMVVYRRTLDEAPANKSEINDAIEEGIIFNFLKNPVEIIGENGHVKAVRVEIMALGEMDNSGRRRPIGTKEYETISCDNLILAIGQGPDKEFIDSICLKEDHGYVVANDDVISSNEKVLVGGDMVRGADSVVRSMVDGKKAGIKIATLLKIIGESNEK